MTSFKSLTLLALILPAAALALEPGQQIGTSDAEVTAHFEGEGYAVTAIEREEDEIEVQLTRNDMAFEVELSPEGQILEIELADGDDDDDDEEDS